MGWLRGGWKDFAVPGRAGPDLIGMRDFRDAVYYPVVAFRHGISPYHAEYVAFHPEGCEFPAFSPLTLLRAFAVWAAGSSSRRPWRSFV